MSSVNTVFLLGNVGKEIKHRTSASGMAIADFSIATNRVSKGEKVTTWHNVRAFGKTAEIVQSYVNTGDSIHVEGSIDNGKYEAKSGETKYFSQVLIKRLTLIGGKRDEQQSGGGQSTSSSADFEDSVPFSPFMKGEI